MNYLAHAYGHLDQPYFAAGTALPDWMNVIDRKNRPRRQYAEPVVDDADGDVAAFASGVVQHHLDDAAFHSTFEFNRLSRVFAVEIRQMLGTDMGHQAGFLGHISIELLLDAVLMQRQPGLLDSYYAMLSSLNTKTLHQATNKICRKPVPELEVLIPRFIQERFLADYHDDHRLLYRLNGVMRRVGLPKLPAPIAEWLATARPRVADVTDALLQLGEPN